MQDTKLRIKLYDPKEGLISDRLVEQTIEFRVGPKEKHKGPISLELNLRDKEDAGKAIEYLNKLLLDLPIETKKPKGRKKVNDMLSSDKPVEELKGQALGKAKTQEELVEFLRQYDFRFVHSQFLEDLNAEKPGLFELKDIHRKYAFMIRLVKEAKNPKADQWDTRLAIGIKLVGEKIDVIKVYLFGKYLEQKKVPWADAKKINFKRKEPLMKFPSFMNLEERGKWRAEHRKLALNAELKPSKFYNRWKPEITIN